jgi:hypothetical protein
VAVTFALDGSMRETVPSSELDTQTDPPAARTSSGTAPTAIVSVTFDVAGSMRETDGSPPDWNSEFTTQIAPSPDEIPMGSPPTGMVASIVGGGVAVPVSAGGAEAAPVVVGVASSSLPPHAATTSMDVMAITVKMRCTTRNYGQRSGMGRTPQEAASPPR